MLCPSCKVDLQMSERQGVELDYCPQCRGVWLDRGELDKILERSRQEFGAPAGQIHGGPASSGYGPQGQHGHGYDARYYDKKRRKRSFFEDLFD